jgi:multidrug efflux pump subunit AcrA (membrane-fusion protein)
MAKANGKRTRKWWWVAGLAVLAGAGAVAARPRAAQEPEKDKVKTATAAVSDVQVRVTEVGSVEPQVKVDV